MRRSGVVVLAGVLAVGLAVMACWAGEKEERPKILGISGVEILSSHVKAAELFYGRLVELDGPCNWCENNPYKMVNIPSGQVLGVSPTPRNAPKSMLASISFAIDNEKVMRRWLEANHIPFKASPGPYSDLGRYLLVFDPDGHALYFRKGAREDQTDYAHLPLIHAGFVVKNREAMDKFYKNLLGFHVYWHGGMKDGETDWVDMQVPDGTDWIEFMLNVPADADKQTLGVMNHIAIGVPDVRATAKALQANGMTLPEKPEIGRDGKWQLNLYDPDETRVELMELTPVQKPCCAEYTGRHPGK